MSVSRKDIVSTASEDPTKISAPSLTVYGSKKVSKATDVAMAVVSIPEATKEVLSILEAILQRARVDLSFAERTQDL